MVHSSNHDDLKSSRRANILRAAREAFARGGPKTTMADIAAAAGVSQGLAYRYFPSKDVIYRELVDQAVEAGHDELAVLRKVSGSPGRELFDLLTRMIEMRRDDPDTFRLLDHATDADDPAVVARRQDFHATLAGLIAAAQKTGEVVAGDVDQLAVAVTACLEGLVRLAARDPRTTARSFPDAAIVLRLLKPEGAS